MPNPPAVAPPGDRDEGKEFPTHPLARKAAEAEGAVRFMCLVGFPVKLGEVVRLYTTLSCEHYFQVQFGAIQYWENVDTNSPNSPIRVYLEHNAPVLSVYVTKAEDLFNYIGGSIVDAEWKSGQYARFTGRGEGLGTTHPGPCTQFFRLAVEDILGSSNPSSTCHHVPPGTAEDILGSSNPGPCRPSPSSLFKAIPPGSSNPNPCQAPPPQTRNPRCP